MHRPSSRRLVAAAIPLALVLAVAQLAAQQPTAADSHAGARAPGGSQAASPANPAAKPGYTKADVEFMQHMIGHHAQALAMTAMVPDRTTNEAMHHLAQRIEVSQRDEIALMRHWLEARGQVAPDPANAPEHHAMGHGATVMLMPGMLTSAELSRLAAAKGAEFDRMFLEFMIRHHEGALTMVASLFATPGAGQEAEVFRFASDVDTDQRAEIARMRTLLNTMARSQHP
ncbi:MAG TPA: DUF305 domain-containing protein [Gemmatimonadales bacterium]|nr:DUF305 domain-containing protein [Gemmatimonadales bacterium]